MSFNQPKFEDAEISRREFLQKAVSGLAVGAGVLLENTESKAEAGPVVDSQAAFELDKSKSSKIEFTRYEGELPPEVNDVLLAVGRFQEKVIWFTDSLETNNAKTIEGVGPTLEEVEQQKKELWEELKKILPNLSDYSSQGFNLVMVRDLPRFLAKYGILAKPMSLPIVDGRSGSFYRFESPLLFYRVEKTESDSVQQWGRELNRDIIYLQDLVLDGKQLNPNKNRQSSGQTFFNNIFIYEEALKNEANYEIDPEIVGRLRGLSSAEWLVLFNNLKNELGDERAAAIQLTFLRLLSNLADNKITPEDTKDMIISHETRHLIDQTDPSFTSRFVSIASENPREYFGASANIFVHEEINGFLGEMRYGVDKRYSLTNLLTYNMKQESGQDYGHDQALRWLFKKIVKMVSDNPDQYGVVIDDQTAMSLESQVIVYLPNIFAKKELVEKLAEEIMAEHQQHYDEDFSEDYIRHLGIPEQKKSGIAWEGVCLSGVAVAGVSALALRWIAKRRQEVAQEEAVTKRKNLKKKKK